MADEYDHVSAGFDAKTSGQTEDDIDAEMAEDGYEPESDWYDEPEEETGQVMRTRNYRRLHSAYDEEYKDEY